MTSGRREAKRRDDWGYHGDWPLNVCRKDHGANKSHCFLDSLWQLPPSFLPILVAPPRLVFFQTHGVLTQLPSPHVLLWVLAEENRRTDSKIKLFIPALHK